VLAETQLKRRDAGVLGRIAGLLPALDSYRRIVYTKTVIVWGFAAGFLLSRRLWISSRYYPVIPVWPWLPHLSYPLDYVCFAALFLLLGFIGFALKPRPYIVGFAVVLVFLALLDQTRWQPWAYLYLFMLLALACFSWKREDIAGQEQALNICRLMVAATYFYSGVQKLNWRFAIGLTTLMGTAGARLHALRAIGWVLACVEIAIAVGLLTRRYRNQAVIFGALMHGFIVAMCAFVYKWNSVVWPWNFAMICLLFLLFWKTEFSFADVLWRNPVWFQKVALVVFGVLPMLSFFGWWDSYLSASLYSANVPEANIFIGESVRRELPRGVQQYVKTLPGMIEVLPVQDWALGELNVPPYPAARTFRAIGAEVCGYAQNSPDLTLVLREKDTLLRKGDFTRDTCLGTLLVKKW
jgi:hypothetical protein